MNPEELEKIPRSFEKLFYDLQNRIMEDVVVRIKVSGEISSTADYQINKMHILGGSSEFIKSEIERLTGLTDKEMQKLYEMVVESDYVRNKDLYGKVGVKQIPYKENAVLQDWVRAVTKQTRDEVVNLTQSMGFALDYGGKKVFTPFSEYYQKYLDAACLDVVTGSFGYDTVLRRVVKEMTASGIRAVDYATGYSNRVTVAARRALLTGAHQINAKLSEQTAKDLGTDDYEVTYHTGHRAEHWWGGRVFSYKELVSVCGLGTVTGLCGANCYHSYYPFIKGISVPTYSEDEIRDMEVKEQNRISWMGKEYNCYEATQKQRQMETQMRKYRGDIHLLKNGNGSKDDIMASQARYINTLRQYQGFSKKMGIPEQMERVYMDGLGRMTPYKTKYLAAEKSLRTKDGEYSVKWNIIKSKQYSERFEKISSNTKANQLAAQRARNALGNRDGKNTEEIYAIGLISGKDVSSIVDQHYPFAVKRTKKFQKDIDRAELMGEKVLFIHNHPEGSPPSLADLNELLNHENAVGITIGHTGSIYYYSRPNRKIKESELFVALRKIKGYTGNVKSEKAIELLAETFGFEFKIL